MSIIPKLEDKAKQLLIKSQKYLGLDTIYLAKGGFWISLSFFINSVLSLAPVIIFANFLPKEAYGTYKYILSLSGSLSFLTLTGMNMAVTQATAKFGSTEILSYAIKIQLKWNSLFFLCASGLATYYFINSNELIATGLIILAVSFPLATTLNTYGAFLSGKKDFKRISTFGISFGLISAIALSIAGLTTSNVINLVLIYALVSFVPSLFFCYRVFSIYKSTEIDKNQKAEIFHFSRQLSFMHILSNIAQYVDKLVVFHFFGAAQLAVYGLALAIPERLRGYQKTTASIMLPKLSEKNIEEIDKSFYKRIFQGASVGLGFCLAYILIAPTFYKYILPKYLESIAYSQLFSFTLIFILPASYVSSVFNAHKMVSTLYKSSLFSSTSRIALYLILGSKFGIWGLIWATLVMYVLGAIYNLYLWEKEVKKRTV
jgi:O-antigen/teichoic acid export membrane protein